MGVEIKVKWDIAFEYKNSYSGLWEKTVEDDTKEKAMEKLRSEIPQEILIIRVKEVS